MSRFCPSVPIRRSRSIRAACSAGRILASTARASRAGLRRWTKLLGIEPPDESDQRRDRKSEVARARVFHRIMADAAPAAHEQHADRTKLRHRLPIMACAGAEPQWLGAQRADRARELILDHRMAWRGRHFARRGDGEAQAPAVRYVGNACLTV